MSEASKMPARIWATCNGMSTRLPDGRRQFIGGWSEDKDRPRAEQFIRADLVEPLVEALRVAVDTLALTEREKTEDPQYGEYIRSIGDKIGYGALMCGAQAEWRKRLREDGDPVGGEFVAGPCYITVLDTLKILRSAIQAYEAAQ